MARTASIPSLADGSSYEAHCWNLPAGPESTGRQSMRNRICCLLIGDSDSTLERIVQHLKAATSDVVCRRVETAEQTRAALDEAAWDIVLADCGIQSFNAQSALVLVQQTGLDVPFIVVCDQADEDTALALVKAGANDYVTTDHLVRLAIAVEREIRHAAARADRRQAEKSLRDQAAALRAIFDQAAVGVAQTDSLTGKFIRVNRKYCEIVGRSPEELAEADFQSLTHPDDLRLDLDHMESLVAGRIPSFTIEKRFLRKDGSVVWARLTVSPLWRAGESPDSHIAVVEDITDRRHSEAERETMLSLLRLMITAGDTRELVRRAIECLHQWSGAEAAAVRLREGDDFPYFETIGFRNEFLSRPDSLLARDHDGTPLRDSQGNPILGCVCATLFGRLDPTLAFYTERGSFWTNSIAALAASVAEEYDPTGLCGPSGAEGYESLALIPMRSGGKVLGLLQFNDRRIAAFNADSIAFLEHAVGNIATVLAQRQAQEALRVSESRLRQTQAFAQMGNWEWDIPAGELRLAEICSQILGEGPRTSRRTMDAFIDALDPGDQPSVRKSIENALTGREPLDIDFRVARPGGAASVVNVKAQVFVNAAGQPTRMSGTMQDITERKRVEAELRQSAQRFRVLFEEAPIAYHETDAEGVILRVNRAQADLLGFSEAEMTGKRIWRFVAPDDQADSEATFRSTLRSGQPPIASERKYWRRDGTVVTVQVHENRIHDVDGNVVGMCAAMLDVTERVRLEEEFRHAQKMEALGRLAGGVAHDFNNILMLSNGYCDLLLRRTTPHDPSYGCLSEIKKAGQRAATLTQRLLTFSRKQISQPQVLDLNEAIRKATSMLRRLIGEDIELVTELNADLRRVLADPGHIDQVLMNLVVNARDAMPDGGYLIIETTNVDVDAAFAAEHADLRPGAYAQLTVTDSGIGMDHDTRERIFEPFFTTKEASKGTGLGLATVYGIVKQSGGAIWVASEPRQGTVFTICLPRIEEAVVAEEIPEPVEPVARGTETILLVEDQLELRKLVRTVLEGLGYTVLEAANSGDALSEARRYPGVIHLLLTDVVMPGLNGRELAQRVRLLRSEIKVLFMSGYSDNAIVSGAALDPGVVYLQKPVSPDQLAMKVREVLGAAPASRAILVVDDDAAIRGYVRQILHSAGYETCEAENGKEAIRRIEAGGVTLVITDIVMPEQEGIETIQILHRRRPTLKIIAMSGAFGTQFLAIARKLGAHATMMKPFLADELLANVRQALADHG